MMFEQMVQESLQKLVESDALYRGIGDHEATILCEWAGGRLGLATAGALTEEQARESLEREGERLHVTFDAIASVIELVQWDRGNVIAAITAVLSRVWNAGY